MVQIVVGTSGNDTLLGTNSDNNIIYGNEGTDSITAGSKGDKVYGWVGDDTLIGSSANDAIGGDQDNDSINGGAGDDQLYGGSGNDTILGGAGEDFVTADDGNDSVDAGDADDVVYGGFGNDTLSGGNNDDFLSGEAGDDSLVGGAGLDELYGVYDNNAYVGGTGRDRFIISPGDATIDGNDKIDTINDFELGTVATGGQAEDLIDIRQLGVSTFAELQTRMTQVGADVQIDFSVSYDRILVIKNVTIAQLFPEHFRFPGDNLAPTASGDNYSVAQDGLLLASSVLANDTDPNNDILTAGISSGPSHALLFQFNQDGSFTYQPTAGYVGTDSFTYIANDGEFFSNATTVTITIGDTGQTITGTPGDDTLTGGPGDDTIDGGPGDDTLTGGGGDDSITGSDGDDTIDGGDGNDTIDGGNGDDSLMGGNDDDLINGSDGKDTIDGGAGNDTINGGAGDDSLIGGAGNDAINGGEDNDYLEGNAGIDTLNGNGGSDTLQGGAGGDQINGSTGLDVASYRDAPTAVLVDLNAGLLSGSDAMGDIYTSIEGAEGSAFDDTLTGDAQDNWLSGRGGNDTLTAMDGNDTMFGGAGTDALLAGNGNDLLEGGAGADVLDGAAGNDTISYASSTVAVNVNLLTSSATGGDATGDTFTSIENLTGSANNDTLTGDTGANVLSGLAGNDSMDGGDGNDTLLGGDGNDLLQGGNGNDSLSGDAGNDTFLGSAGADTNNGGAGTDTADYTASAGAVNVNLTTGTGTGGDAQGDTFTSIEVVIGSALNDTLTGSASADTLNGGAGNDIIVGGAGADLLQGGAGQDTLTDNTGNDTLTGGSNDDVFFINQNQGSGTLDTITDFMNVTGDDKINLTDFPTIDGFDDLVITTFAPGVYDIALPGSQTLRVTAEGPLTEDDFILNPPTGNVITGTESNDTLTGTSGVDTIFGLGGDDSLSGNGSGDSIVGGNGNDTAFGNAGNDTIDGGDGNDSLDGGTENDSIVGGNGDDYLQGADGIDTIIGNAGNDTLVGGAGADSFDGNAGIDVISYITAGSLVVVNMGTNSATGAGDATGDVFSNTNIEGAIGSNFNDTLTGDSNTNYFDGAAGTDMIWGLDGNDTLLGGAGDDTVFAGNGDDSVNGGTERDILLGDAGNDTLSGDAGDDTLFGGAGNDSMIGGDGNDFGGGDDGNDTFDGGLGDDALFGYTGNDSLIGNAGNDVLSGESGNDTLAGGTGADTINGGDGTDVVTYAASASAVNVNLATGTGTGGDAQGDVLALIENLIGSNFNDSLVGDAGNNDIYGGTGNDTLDAGAGNDNYYGGAGNDRFVVGVQPNTTDTIWDFNPLATDKLDLTSSGLTPAQILAVSAQVGADVVISLPNSQVVILKNVNLGDLDPTDFEGPNADGIVNGTAGNDVIDAAYTDVDGDKITAGNDTINGLAGNDSIFGLGGNDNITGGTGNDTLSGDAGNDTYNFTFNNTNGSDFVYDNGGTIIIDGKALAGTAVKTGASTYSLTVSGTVFILTKVNADLEITKQGDTADKVTLVNFGGGYGFTVPNADGIVNGTTGNNLIDAAYVDADGDKVTAGNDTVIGNGGNDTVYGLDGNDSITVGNGNDLVYGGDGNDTIATGAGNDYIETGAGNDRVDAGDGDDSLHNDKNGSSGADTLLGGAGNDGIYAGVGAESIDGGAGTDGLIYETDTVGVNVSLATNTASGGNAAGDVFVNIENLEGGAGNDTLTGSAIGNWLEGNAGNDTIVANDGDDTLIGGAGNDTLSGGNGRDTLVGGTGNDSLLGGAGSSDRYTFTFDGTNGIDTISDTDGGVIYINDLLLAGAAVKTAVANQYSLTVTGTTFLLTFVGTDLEITKQGGSVNDKVIVKAFNGPDWGITLTDGVVTGTTGADAINLNSYVDADGDKVTTGNDKVLALGGNDNVNADAGNDTVDGGDGNDYLYGGAGNDSLMGGNGHDYVFGGAGADTMNGGDGFDYVSYRNATAAVALSLTTGAGTAGDAAGDVIISFGGVEGSNFNDTIVGDADVNSFRGFSGNDSFSSMAGDDILHAGDGADTVDGGAGNDVAFAVGNDVNVASNINMTTGTVNGLVTGDVYINVETISGGNGNDTITLGGQGILNAMGSFGSDSIVGDAAGNILYGDGPTFGVDGTFGNDTLFGGAGNDTLFGDAGNDSLIGGTGADRFQFTFNGSNGTDLVFDDSGVIVIDDKLVTGTAVRTATANQYTLTVSGTTFLLTIVGADLEITKQGGSANDKVIVKNFGAGWDITLPPLGDGTVTGTAGNDNINGSYVDAQGDRVTTGNDVIFGLAGKDTIDGQAGNDVIYGDNTIPGSSTTVIPGGTAKGVESVIVTLHGVPTFNIGFGNNSLTKIATITDTDHDNDGDKDSIETNSSEGLIVKFKGETNNVTVSLDGFSTGESVIWTAYDALNREVDSGLILAPTWKISADDNFASISLRPNPASTAYTNFNLGSVSWGTPKDEVTTTLTDGNDSINAGDGNDTVYGGGDNDTVQGGTGNDLIYGDYNITGADAETATAASSGAGLNLVKNGSFEQFTGAVPAEWGLVVTGINYWNITGAPDFDLVVDGYYGTQVADGKYTLDMERFTDLTVKQTITGVQTGEVYDLSFSTSGNTLGRSAVMDVFWGNKLVTTVSATLPVLKEYTFKVVGGAGDGSNTLKFVEKGIPDKSGVMLDDVQLKVSTDGTGGTDGGIGGNDNLFGNDGSDTIYAGAGNDTLTGGAGNDILTGGLGNDRFVLAQGSVDTIMDFVRGEDKIQVLGTTAFNQIDVNASIANGTTEISIKGVGVVGVIDHAQILTASDFVF